MRHDGKVPRPLVRDAEARRTRLHGAILMLESSGKQASHTRRYRSAQGPLPSRCGGSALAPLVHPQMTSGSFQELNAFLISCPPSKEEWCVVGGIARVHTRASSEEFLWSANQWAPSKLVARLRIVNIFPHRDERTLIISALALMAARWRAVLPA